MTETAPCRLFMTEEEVFPFHWQEVVGQMKEFIQNETRLSLNSRRVHIMFQSSVENSLFLSDFCKIGLEVIGPSSEVDDEYEFFDRDELTVYQQIIPFTASLEAETLFSIVKQAQKELKVSQLWEIVLTEQNNKLMCEVNLFIK